MSEPITWRSVSAPNFGASAALLNSGGETLNQGITSLAAVAKGYADEQKGIAVSNAVADLSNTTNDADRMAAFTAHSANLKDHGIDLKDLIAANQAQHKTLQGDATFASDQALSASDLAGNVLEQAGLGIRNKTDQSTLDNLPQVQGDAHNSALQNILQSNSSIKASDAAAAHSNAATTALGDAKTEKVATEAGMATLFKELQNPDNFIKDANGVPISVDKALAYKKTLASGVSMPNLVKGDAAMSILTDEATKAEAAKTEKANQEKRDFAVVEQGLKTEAKNRDTALTSTLASLDTDTSWLTGNFGQDKQYNSGAALVTAAYATQYTDASGKSKHVPPALINEIIKANNSDGDLKEKEFNDEFSKAVARLSKEK